LTAVAFGLAFYTHHVYSPCVKGADLTRQLQAAGWMLDRVRGSHHVFRHPAHPNPVVVPHPKKELGRGLVAAIRKQAGLGKE
jgi:predicted RNA binding protein YcfA (HicA-like mRNA interferase family)